MTNFPRSLLGEKWLFVKGLNNRLCASNLHIASMTF